MWPLYGAMEPYYRIITHSRSHSNAPVRIFLQKYGVTQKKTKNDIATLEFEHHQPQAINCPKP